MDEADAQVIRIYVALLVTVGCLLTVLWRVQVETASFEPALGRRWTEVQAAPQGKDADLPVISPVRGAAHESK